VITEEDARELILKKHHDLISEQLNQYLSSELNTLQTAFDLFSVKYFTPESKLRGSQEQVLKELDNFFDKLGYRG